MSNRCLRPLAALSAIVCLTTPGRAQPQVVPVLKGELRSESPVNFRDYRVEMHDLNHRSEVQRADANTDGTFEFRRFPAGDYQLSITSIHGDVIQQEFVTVNSQTTHFSVRLTQSHERRNSAPGTISVTQLRHPPDRKALQSFVTAQRLSAGGSPEKAAAELEKAVRISPEFADAYSNLAVQHIRMGRFQEAADEVLRALSIAGPNPAMLCNLAYAQINLGRVQESLASVRAALRLDAGFPQAHLILGSILAADPRTLADAIPHLKLAAETIPSARGTLERAHERLRAAQ